MELLIGIAVVVAAVMGVSVGAIAMGRSGSNAEIRDRLAAEGLTPEQAATLREAELKLRESTKLLYDVRNLDVRAEARNTIEKADKLLDTMKVQPAEIRRAGQFFMYYVPTLPIILRKFVTLEVSGTLAPDDPLIDTTKEHLVDMAHAFDLMNENLYKDESLDLTVEVEAMKMALKREGLS